MYWLYSTMLVTKPAVIDIVEQQAIVWCLILAHGQVLDITNILYQLNLSIAGLTLKLKTIKSTT